MVKPMKMQKLMARKVRKVSVHSLGCGSEEVLGSGILLAAPFGGSPPPKALAAALGPEVLKILAHGPEAVKPEGS
jgi:hypothetical protein